MIQLTLIIKYVAEQHIQCIRSKHVHYRHSEKEKEKEKDRFIMTELNILKKFIPTMEEY